MSTREFFAQRLTAELPAFRRVIRALPADRLDYTPHERSTNAAQLAWQLAYEMDHLSTLFTTGEVRYEPSDPPGGVDEIASAFDRYAQAALDRLEDVSEEHWNAPAKFYVQGQVAWETTVSEMAWGYLFDLVHHRGQLSSYIRPMGGKVPSIYGPSADDRG